MAKLVRMSLGMALILAAAWIGQQACLVDMDAPPNVRQTLIWIALLLLAIGLVLMAA